VTWKNAEALAGVKLNPKRDGVVDLEYVESRPSEVPEGGIESRWGIGAGSCILVAYNQTVTLYYHGSPEHSSEPLRVTLNAATTKLVVKRREMKYQVRIPPYHTCLPNLGGGETLPGLGWKAGDNFERCRVCFHFGPVRAV
jgi:hypothetical protein